MYLPPTMKIGIMYEDNFLRVKMTDESIYNALNKMEMKGLFNEKKCSLEEERISSRKNFLIARKPVNNNIFPNDTSSIVTPETLDTTRDILTPINNTIAKQGKRRIPIKVSTDGFKKGTVLITDKQMIKAIEEFNDKKREKLEIKY